MRILHLVLAAYQNDTWIGRPLLQSEASNSNARGSSASKKMYDTDSHAGVCEIKQLQGSTREHFYPFVPTICSPEFVQVSHCIVS
jgi:hypothetical protein